MTLFAWFLIYFWNHAFMYLHLSIMHMHFSFILSCCLSVFVWLFTFYFVFFSKKKKKKEEEEEGKIKKKYKKVYFVYIGTCVPWMDIKTKFSKLCIFCNLDEHLYAQLSKWALWLLFVMSKIKLSLVLDTHITLFYRND